MGSERPEIEPVCSISVENGRQPRQEISSMSFSSENERGPLCGVATIEDAEVSVHLTVISTGTERSGVEKSSRPQAITPNYSFGGAYEYL